MANQLNQKVLESLENNLRIELGHLFVKMNGLIQSELGKYWNDSLLLQGQVNLIVAPIHELHQEYDDLLNRYKLEVLRKGYSEGQRLVKRAYRNNRYALKEKKPVRFKHSEDSLFGTLPETEDKLRQDTFTASDKTLSRVDESISEILSNGYREGHGIDQVARDIQERFSQLKDWEATRIARTELHTAHSLGRRTAYQDMNVSYTEWIATHDKRTRRSHALIDGEVTTLDGKYSNGLLYPGDKAGPIEEWINCRCSEAPFVMPPGMQAPPGMSHFKESDLVSVAEPNYDQLLGDATGGRLDWETFRESLYDYNALDALFAEETRRKLTTEQQQEYDNITTEILQLQYELTQNITQSRRAEIEARLEELYNQLKALVNF